MKFIAFAAAAAAYRFAEMTNQDKLFVAMQTEFPATYELDHEVPDYKNSVAWDPSTLPNCPDDISPDIKRSILPDYETYATRYPMVGATCV